MPWIEIFTGIKRKIVQLAGAIKPLSTQNTTMPVWFTTPPYDPLHGETIVGYDRSERINLARDGKLYPPLTWGGLPADRAQAWYESAIAAGGSELLSTTNHVYWRLMSIRNPTGGAIVVTLSRAAGVGAWFSKSLAAGEGYIFPYPVDTVGPVYADGSGAAGCNLYYTTHARD